MLSTVTINSNYAVQQTLYFLVYFVLQKRNDEHEIPEARNVILVPSTSHSPKRGYFRYLPDTNLLLVIRFVILFRRCWRDRARRVDSSGADVILARVLRLDDIGIL